MTMAEAWKLSAEQYSEALIMAIEGLKYDDAARRKMILVLIEAKLQRLKTAIEGATDAPGVRT